MRPVQRFDHFHVPLRGDLDSCPPSEKDVIVKELRGAASMFIDGWEAGDESILIKQFTGGLSNKLFCLTKATRKVLIRIYGTEKHAADDGDPHVFSLVDYDREIEVFRLLHHHKLSPPFYAVFANGSSYGHVEGVSTKHTEICEPWLAKIIAFKLAEWHALPVDPESCVGNSLFLDVKRWLSILPPDFHALLGRSSTQLTRENITSLEDIGLCGRDALFAELVEVTAALEAVDAPTVLCHNDVNPLNIIYNKEKGTANFIDFEYACANYAAYDIGNHFCEYTTYDLDWTLFPSEETRKLFVAWYITKVNMLNEGVPEAEAKPTSAEVDALFRASTKCTLASHLCWGIWGLLQALNSRLSYDFLSYAVRRLVRYSLTKAEFLNL